MSPIATCSFKRMLFALSPALFFTLYTQAQTPLTRDQQAAVTEVYTPVPPIVTPGKTFADPPSDAVILFNGKNLDEWTSDSLASLPAPWKVVDGTMMVVKSGGDIATKQKFLDYQLHIEFRIPENITGSGQARGNSGIFLAGTGKGEEGYELQVLDNYNNTTYVNGQVGSIYKQSIPLANPAKKPGEWQGYDVVWTAPRFNEDSSLASPGRVTAFLNGVLVQNNFSVKGVTQWIGQPYYKKHGPSSIKLQAHGDKSEPISYRNIWLRRL